MAITYQKVINIALGEIGVLPLGQNPSAEATRDALDRLILLLDSESIAGVTSSAKVRRTATLSSSQLVYTIAPAGDADLHLSMPAELDVVLFRIASSYEFRPIDEISDRSLSLISSLEGLSGHPSSYVLDRGNPEQIWFDVAPDVGSQVRFVGRDWLSEDIDTAQAAHEPDWPRGTHRDIALLLAKEMAPSYGVQLDRATLRNSMDARSRLQSRNDTPRLVIFDDAMLGNRSITNC